MKKLVSSLVVATTLVSSMSAMAVDYQCKETYQNRIQKLTKVHEVTWSEKSFIAVTGLAFAGAGLAAAGAVAAPIAVGMMLGVPFINFETGNIAMAKARNNIKTMALIREAIIGRDAVMEEYKNIFDARQNASARSRLKDVNKRRHASGLKPLSLEEYLEFYPRAVFNPVAVSTPMDNFALELSGEVSREEIINKIQAELHSDYLCPEGKTLSPKKLKKLLKQDLSV